jgi:hypothetical protein
MIFKKVKAKEDDVFKNKLEIAELSKKIFKQNKGLIMFPVLGALLSIITFVLLIMISKGSGAVVFALIIWYLIFKMIVSFFNTATVACSKAALNGESKGFSYGIKEGFKRMHLIINWGLFDGILGFMMGLLTDLKLTKSFKYTGEISWGLVKFFIIPFMTFENKNVKDSIYESQKLIKKNWGRSHSGDYKIIFVSFVPFVIVLLILIFSSVLKDEVVTYSLFVITIFTLLLGTLINFSVRSIFSTVLYTNVKGKTK